MTETSERGITINKALAWTMLVSVIGLIWWGGGTLASLQGAADRLTSALTDTREMIMAERASSAQLEARVRVLENSATRQGTRFDALSLSINELKLQAREANTRLRELAQGLIPPSLTLEHPTRPHGGFFVARRRAERAIQ